MARTPSIYRRLTGKRRRLTGFSQLWLGPDHILLVNSTRFVERYQRFAFADIAAIAITEAGDATIPRFMGGAFAIFWTALALAVNSVPAKRFFLVTGLAAIALMLFELARGRRCRCHLHTAVSRELLASVSRERIARAFLAAVTPEIERMQGTLSPEPIAALEHAPGAADSPAAAPAVPKPRNYVPEVLFGLLILDPIVMWAVLRWAADQAPGLFMITYFAELVLMVVVLARGPRTYRRPSFVVVILALICFGADLVNVGQDAAAWFMQVVQAAQTNTQPPAVFWTPTAGQSLFSESWRLAAGAAGWLAIWAERHTRDAS